MPCFSMLHVFFIGVGTGGGGGGGRGGLGPPNLGHDV